MTTTLITPIGSYYQTEFYTSTPHPPMTFSQLTKLLSARHWAPLERNVPNYCYFKNNEKHYDEKQLFQLCEEVIDDTTGFVGKWYIVLGWL